MGNLRRAPFHEGPVRRDVSYAKIGKKKETPRCPNRKTVTLPTHGGGDTKCVLQGDGKQRSFPLEGR